MSSQEPCPICRRRPATTGVACAPCLERIGDAPAVVPDQIRSTVGQPCAALIDPWGRPHLLSAVAAVGRGLTGDGVSILDGSVSRRHLELRFGDDPRRWTVRDFGSANGTWINGVAVAGEAPLVHGDVLSVSHVGLIFVAHVPREPAPIDPLSVETVRPGQVPVPEMIAPILEEITLVGLPELDVDLAEPSGGGGGVVQVGGRQTHVSMIQFELLRLMVDRMVAEEHVPDAVRGFIRSTEMLVRLSWDTSSPSEEHVKQLVRRARRVLVAAGIGDLIESRHGLGYRLRGCPRRRSHAAVRGAGGSTPGLPPDRGQAL